MAVRRGRPRQFTRAPGRTDWARSVSTAHLALPAATKLFVGSFGLANPGISETVRRTRGMISAFSDTSSLNEIVGAFGMVVVSSTAVAVGATAIPGPITDESDDGWFVWVPFVAMGSQSAGGQAGYRADFDSKAMRTVDEGFEIAVVFENAHATNAIEVAFGVSLLASRR